MGFKDYLNKRKSGGRDWWRPREPGEEILAQLVQTIEEDTPNSKYHSTQVVHELVKLDDEGQPVGTVWTNAIPLLQWKLERLHSQGVSDEDLAAIVWRIQYQGKEVITPPGVKPEKVAHAFDVEGMAPVPGSDGEWGSWVNVGDGEHQLMTSDEQQEFWKEKKAADEPDAPKAKAKKGGK